ncbi:hypothetical protein [Planococcus beigongshangi]|uniref:hypothetical protein n=1 Tax=Planococcus beigongshangi TaxID=2782536 RepID=UPI00193B5AF3|nr:hypothetical protein [Planococcus beigongshangi]
MGKIQGVENLLVYLESVGYPLTEQQIDEFLRARTIPHSKPYGGIIVFDSNHIEWWMDLRRKHEFKPKIK